MFGIEDPEHTYRQSHKTSMTGLVALSAFHRRSSSVVVWEVERLLVVDLPGGLA